VGLHFAGVFRLNATVAFEHVRALLRIELYP